MDRTPPQVLSTFPAADSTNVHHLEYIEIRFDEPIDRASVRNQVWLVPETPHGFEIKWKGSKRMRVVLRDSLKQDRTYLLTVGTGVKDIRGNALNNPIVVPFSTGPVIDRGEISGVVQGEQVTGTYIYAYPLSDTLSAEAIFRYRPLYVTQVGKEGNFRLQYLKPGAYRVFALQDQDGNRRYTLQTDQIGIPFRDVFLDAAHPTFRRLNFTLIREDTTAPRIARVQSRSARRVEVQFTESVRLTPATTAIIQDSLTGAVLPVLAVAPVSGEAGNIYIFTAPQNEQHIYRGILRSLEDAAGNSVSEEGIPFRFRGSAAPDTVRPRLLTITPARGANRVRFDARITLRFSLPVDSLSLAGGVELLGQDSAGVAGKWEVISPMEPVFIPEEPLAAGTEYTVAVHLSRLRTVFGDSLGDSLYTHRFSTWPKEELGEIAGIVTAGDTTWKQAIVRAVSLRGNDAYSVVTPLGRPYEVPFVPEGRYRVSAVVDVNGNGEYDPGGSIPFNFAEPFVIYPDTVNVRKRWATDGIDFRF